MNNQDRNVEYSPTNRISNVYSNPKSGDILFSSRKLPHGGILYWNEPKKKDYYHISIRNLREYLEFLELFVLNDRVIIGYPPSFQTPITADEFDNDVVRKIIEDYTKYYQLVTAFQLGDSLRDLVKDEGLIIEAIVQDSSLLSPDKLVTRYLPVDASLNKLQDKIMKEAREVGLDEDISARISHSILGPEYGCPLYLSEFCRTTGIPYMFTDHERDILSSQMNMESTVRVQVVSELKEHLDRGARNLLVQLSRFGTKTVFPQTPIASMVLDNSNRPEDINTVALQLRAEYKKIRNCMNQMQQEIAREDTSLERRLRISKELQTLCSELWSDKKEGWRTVVEPATGFLNLAIESTSAPTLQTVAKAVNFIVKQPFELITRALRRRKIQVLLEAKKSFLKSSNWSQKLAQIFNISEEEVKTAQLRYSQSLASHNR